MKKLAGLLAIMLTIGGSAFAKGKDGKNRPSSDASVNVSLVAYDNNKGVTLKAANETKEDVSISIYDTAGETVYTEVQTSAMITRNYNLNSLPNGIYTVTVTTDHYTVSKSLDIR